MRLLHAFAVWCLRNRVFLLFRVYFGRSETSADQYKLCSDSAITTMLLTASNGLVHGLEIVRSAAVIPVNDPPSMQLMPCSFRPSLWIGIYDCRAHLGGMSKHRCGDIASINSRRVVSAFSIPGDGRLHWRIFFVVNCRSPFIDLGIHTARPAHRGLIRLTGQPAPESSFHNTCCRCPSFCV